MLTAKHLLIIEDEFLIALDIQRIIESAHAQQTVFARNFSEAAKLIDRFDSFDLAIINPPQEDEEAKRVAALLAAARPAIVVSSAARLSLEGTPLDGCETVYKPFTEDELLNACQRALAGKQQPA